VHSLLVLNDLVLSGASSLTSWQKADDVGLVITWVHGVSNSSQSDGKADEIEHLAGETAMLLSLNIAGMSFSGGTFCDLSRNLLLMT
jgi:hypothetical protein